MASFVAAAQTEQADEPGSPSPTSPDQLGGVAMPGPRIAAVAIMALLAFGVLVGSLVNSGTGIANGAAAGLVVAVSPANHSTPVPGGSAAAPASSPATPQATTTIVTKVVTSPAPPSPPLTAAIPVTPVTPAITPSPTPQQPPPSSPSLLPPIKHVFLILLSGQGFGQAFGPAPESKYLALNLRRQGELLQNYYAVTSGSLSNELALVSGQGPTPDTLSNCPMFSDIAPGTVGADQQVLGNGCVYPAGTPNLGVQLTATGHTWRSYLEGLAGGTDPSSTSCRHPPPGGTDPNQSPRPGDSYVTWSNPFVYFHAVIDKRACGTEDVDLSRLASDLSSKRKAPSFAYIVPDRCHDGSDQACAPGALSGLGAAEPFLRSVVPEIEHSPAYKAGGLIAITFDQAPQSGPFADPSACCDNPTYPNVSPGAAPTTPPAPTSPGAGSAPGSAPTTTTIPTTGTTTSPGSTTTPPPISVGPTTPTGGGGQVGLLLISRFVKPGSVENIDFYNHFSLLASIEDLFGVHRLGYAKDPQLPVFDAAVYNAYKPK